MGTDRLKRVYLTDGSIEKQKPDGKEIVASMQRAVIDDEDFVRWSEVCYCPTPLQHERDILLPGPCAITGLVYRT